MARLKHLPLAGALLLLYISLNKLDDGRYETDELHYVIDSLLDSLPNNLAHLGYCVAYASQCNRRLENPTWLPQLQTIVYNEFECDLSFLWMVHRDD